jgi:hypothetical protein
MCEVNFKNNILFAVSALLDPGLMRAFQFFVKGETVLPEKACDVFVTPVVQSSRHNLESYSAAPASNKTPNLALEATRLASDL